LLSLGLTCKKALFEASTIVALPTTGMTFLFKDGIPVMS
jgi:hypothetical protein